MKKGSRTETGKLSLCEWCANDDKPIRCKGLCQTCYGISRRLAGAKAKYEESQNIPQYERNSRERAFRVAKRQMEIAQWEGVIYGNIEQKQVDGDKLEAALVSFSKRFTGKEMFWGWSTYHAFDSEFTEKQRKIIFKIIARMTREYLRKKRGQIAINTASMIDGWQRYI